MLTLKNIPRHVGVIMDGNGRWAKGHKKERTFGHTNAITAIKETLQACLTYNIKIVTLFAFSTENWKRSQKEISLLFDLFYKYLIENQSFFIEQDICLKHIGKKDKLSPKLISLLQERIEETKNNRTLQLNLAVDYGGKSEIIRTCQKIMQANIPQEELTEDVFNRYLDNPAAANVDLLIRTSGEQRLSNFLLWQSAYAEIFFSPTLWPDFKQADFEKALLFYDTTEQRQGKA